MSKMLSELLDATEPTFSIAIKQLEQTSGNTSADVRLSSEILGKVHIATRSLGLDPRDTAGQELYFALMDLARRHDEFLAHKLGATDAGDVADLLPRICQAVDHLNIARQAWVLKHSVARRLLKATPPKKTMKALGYRSVDSMLKREPIGELFGAIRFVESSEWLTGFIKKYSKLTPSDFENRDIEILYLDPRKWGDAAAGYLATHDHNVSHLKEFGTVYVLPLPFRQLPGITLTVLPLLLHYINEIRSYSAFFKLRQVRHDFGSILIETLTSDPANHAVMAGQEIHWRIIHRYFGDSGQKSHPELFEPHVQPEDLHWRKAEEVLYRLEPALHFWHDMDYVAGLSHGEPVSFNLMDMALNYVNRLEYSDRIYSHFREALWNEIFLRYIGQKPLETAILKQLDNELLEPARLLKGVA